MSVGSFDDWVVTEDYEYRGALGQLSSKTTTVEILEAEGTTTPMATFTQGWSYDALGNVLQLDYPECTAGRCLDGPSDTAGPAHRLTTAYNQGFPMQISSPFFVRAEYGYHDNFQLAQTDLFGHHSFYVSRELRDKGTLGMARPSRIRFEDRSGITLWDSGFYSYDGAGNITAIGSDRYTYDGAGRLLSGTVKQD